MTAYSQRFYRLSFPIGGYESTACNSKLLSSLPADVVAMAAALLSLPSRHLANLPLALAAKCGHRRLRDTRVCISVSNGRILFIASKHTSLFLANSVQPCAPNYFTNHHHDTRRRAICTCAARTAFDPDRVIIVSRNVTPFFPPTPDSSISTERRERRLRLPPRLRFTSLCFHRGQI